MRESCILVDRRDSQSMVSAGLGWASRIMTLALEFSVPVAIGVGLDRWLRSMPFLTIGGAIFGFILFMFHTLRMARELATKTDHPAPQSAEKRK